MSLLSSRLNLSMRNWRLYDVAPISAISMKSASALQLATVQLQMRGFISASAPLRDRMKSNSLPFHLQGQGLGQATQGQRYVQHQGYPQPQASHNHTHMTPQRPIPIGIGIGS